jgi:hypothetical protein
MTATPYSASTAPCDSQLPVPSRPSRSAWPWWLMTIMSGGTAIYAAHYFLGRPTGHFGEHFPILLAHITGGSVALLLGPWQFSTKLRERALNLHRWARTHLSGRSRARVTRWIHAGILFRGGSSDTLRLWRSCRTVVRHRADSIQANSSRQHRIAPPVDGSQLRAHSCRGYAAHELPLMLVARMQFSHAYVIVSWLCWVPNLLVADWLLRRQASQVNHFSPERVFRPTAPSDFSSSRMFMNQ